jgi:hypothetical protein
VVYGSWRKKSERKILRLSLSVLKIYEKNEFYFDFKKCKIKKYARKSTEPTIF